MVTFHASIYGLLYGGMLICTNIAAGSFHTKKLCSGLYLIEIEFYFVKTQNAF